MSDGDRCAKEQDGLAARKAWVEKHGDAIVDEGGPLGGAKRTSRDGVADVANELAVFIVVRASSHEAAAKMFEHHPHFTIFPGDAGEVMPLLPVPSATSSRGKLDARSRNHRESNQGKVRIAVSRRQGREAISRPSMGLLP